jgi:two-component system OmpR family response regulator
MGEKTLLVISTNRLVIETLNLTLSKNYTIKIVSDSFNDLKPSLACNPDAIVIDSPLKEKDVTSLCSGLRSAGAKAPVLVLSADSKLQAKLEAFAAGADDYLVKPFSIGELKARLEVSIRTNKSFTSAYPQTNPLLILDKSSRSVIREGGQAIVLRKKEFLILEYLVSNAGQTVSRHSLASYVWESSEKPWSNSVDVHIKHLRDKIDKPFEKRIITTIHGYGYRLENY